MKKTIKIILSIGILFSIITGTAIGASINNDSRDLDTLRVSKNSGTNQKWGSELGKIVPGDQISFSIYYHSFSSVGVFIIWLL